LHNYYISNKDFFKECDKEGNVEVTGGFYYFLFEKNNPVNK
jgi:hypothetical protein